MNQLIEQTLIILKPDALERGLAGEIISRFEKVGLKIVKARLIKPDRELAEKHYPTTDQWLEKVGNNTITDCQKYQVDVKEAMGTDVPKEIGNLVHEWNVKFFTSAPVLALALEGFHAIEVARKLCGPTLPLLSAPGTIRGDLSSASALSENIEKMPIRNLVHASGDRSEAKREIELWFGKE